MATATARPSGRGVTITSTGHYLPSQVLTNADLERCMDTSDEWIVQRTGIRERRVAAEGESVSIMAANAAAGALRQAGLTAADLDLTIVATVGAEMGCPSAACLVLDQLDRRHGLGHGPGGAFDITAACSGFVYALNVAHDLIRGGAYRTAMVIGAEKLTDTQEYNTRGRGTSIIFGDGAGAAILRAVDDPALGVLAQAMHSDGTRWNDLFIPEREPRDFPGGHRAEGDEQPLGMMRMNGRGIFKFAVTTFSDLIAQTLERAGVRPEDVDQFICHQSNVRILEGARDRFGIPHHKMAINIDRVGNTSAASVPILLDELRSQGRVHPGQKVMFVAFGGGLTWTSSLWQL